jgi:hypothetical protein
VLRGALRGWVPDEILDAPKRGFRLPLGDWLRGELRGYARDVLLDRRAVERGCFRGSYVRELLDRHAAGVQDHSQGIWTLLMFELWQQEFVDVAPRRRDAAPARIEAPEALRPTAEDAGTRQGWAHGADVTQAATRAR